MARRRIPRPVKVDPPAARAPFVDPSTGVLTPHGLKVVGFLRDRTGGDEDGLWAALGLTVSGLTQLNQVGQRVGELEAATAAVQGAVAGLRGDPRLEKAVEALGVAVTALVQVQARASGETEKRLGDLSGLVSSFGARMTKAQQNVAMQVDSLQIEANKTNQLQTANLQRLGAQQVTLENQFDALSGGLDQAARNAISGSGAIDYDANTGVIDLPTQTGWSAPTGTDNRATFDTTSVTLSELAERVKALIDDLTTTNILGA
jgi:hypothetical protein